MILIRQVDPTEADTLTQIALSAKRHWDYPERWMEIWSPQLTFTAEYFEENESWVAMEDENPIAFYTLQGRWCINQEVGTIHCIRQSWLGNLVRLRHTQAGHLVESRATD